jgi:hypothetical protein
MTNAGYPFTGTKVSGENIAWRGTTGFFFNSASYITRQHQDLFVDAGISGRGHRKAMVNGRFEEVGIATVSGSYSPGGITYNALIQVQDFAGTSDRGPFITGVVYRDSVVSDNFYTVGEGWADVTVTAYDENGDAISSMATWPGGGYTLEVPAGATYTVIASGGGLGNGTVTQTDVVVDDLNVKVDLDPDDVVVPLTRTIAIEVSGSATPNGEWLIDPAEGSHSDTGSRRTFIDLEPTTTYDLQHAPATNG